MNECSTSKNDTEREKENEKKVKDKATKMDQELNIQTSSYGTKTEIEIRKQHTQMKWIC